MIRTWCLVFAFWWHAAQGAKAGDVIVSANAVLINLFEVSAYLVDGFAYAAEALVGQSVGARDRQRYRDAVAITTLWALVAGTLLAFVIYFGGPAIIDALATNAEVRATAKDLSAVGSDFRRRRGDLLPARRHFHRRDADRGHAQHDGAQSWLSTSPCGGSPPGRSAITGCGSPSTPSSSSAPSRWACG